MSVANIKNFRQFYLTFPEAGKRYALRGEGVKGGLAEMAQANPSL